MEYVNGFAKKEFLRYMFCEFPGVFCNTFAREMLTMGWSTIPRRRMGCIIS